MKTLFRAAAASVAALAVMMSVMVLTPSAQIVGDVNQNDALDSDDVRVMMKYMVGNRPLSAEERVIADCDGDGRVNTRDIRRVLSAITSDEPLSTLPTTTTTTTTTTRPSLDDEGYYDDVVKP